MATGSGNKELDAAMKKLKYYFIANKYISLVCGLMKQLTNYIYSDGI